MNIKEKIIITWNLILTTTTLIFMAIQCERQEERIDRMAKDQTYFENLYFKLLDVQLRDEDRIILRIDNLEKH